MAQSLSSAIGKAATASQLAALDALGTAKGDFQADNMNVLEIVAGDFIKRVKTNIQQEKLPVSGEIEDIAIQITGEVLNIVAPIHLVFQDAGVNGSVSKQYNTPFSYKDKAPPVEIFKDWIKNKNIQLRRNEDFHDDGSPFKELTDEQKIERAAYAMRWKVFTKGFRPRNVYTKELDQLADDVMNALGSRSVTRMQDLDSKDTTVTLTF